MDPTSSLPGSPGGPLNAASPERVNQQRDPPHLANSSMLFSSVRESSVHEKISQFNTLAMQSKQLERKTADAALKRAMLGREEAESEMRRYRDEARALRKMVDEGKERERRVGERLETVMEQYGRAKETYAHTQALWEKEIRRTRKETFKSQSTTVKMQEEVKALRSAVKAAEESIEREKGRSRVREQEAFAARYQLVGVQEQLDQAAERVKVVEQERDAFKTLAKNEEVARIAAEGRLPLPPGDNEDDELASPTKKSSKTTARVEPRVSLSTVDIVSSAASEEEIDELTRLVQWERQRADRAQDMVEFLQAECQLQCCPCAKAHKRQAAERKVEAPPLSPRKKRRETIEIVDPSDLAILGATANTVESPVELQGPCLPQAVETLEAETTTPADAAPEATTPTDEEPTVEVKPEERRSTIFCPREGIFRTISQQEAEAMEKAAHAEAPPSEPPTPVDARASTLNPRMYARTPSVEPPSFALLAQERTSLFSLLNAPLQEADTPPLPKGFVVPVTPSLPVHAEASRAVAQPEEEQPSYESQDSRPNQSEEEEEEAPENGLSARPHTSAAFYTVTTTTTIPLREDNLRPETSIGHRERDHTPPDEGGNSSGTPSFDANNPAMTPTMTREQALAQIRERRGRARSAAQGAATPRKPTLPGAGSRRDISAPMSGRTKSRTRS